MNNTAGTIESRSEGFVIYTMAIENTTFHTNNTMETRRKYNHLAVVAPWKRGSCSFVIKMCEYYPNDMRAIGTLQVGMFVIRQIPVLLDPALF